MDFLRAYSATFRATLSLARAFATTDREDFSLESAFVLFLVALPALQFGRIMNQ
jgi:hypothetical protein